MSDFEFEVIIDTSMSNLLFDSQNIDSHYVLSCINDFENGKWRYDWFNRTILNNMKETCLSAREREALCDRPYDLLSESAINLRIPKETDVGYGSEISEILLYMIMKSHFGALPVVPKIFYKQNVNDNAKGADSVHVVLDENGFTLWLGEAKFYSAFSDSLITKTVQSIKESLKDDKIKKENCIITNLNDLDKLISDKSKCDEIRDALNKKHSLDKIKSILHVPILILYQCDITAMETIMNDGYVEEIKMEHSKHASDYFKKHESVLSEIPMIEKIAFHLILIPVPEKKTVVEKFMNSVKTYR